MRHLHLRALARGALYDGQLKSCGEISWWIAEHNKIDVDAVRLILVLQEMATEGELVRIEDGLGPDRVVWFAAKRKKKKYERRESV